MSGTIFNVYIVQIIHGTETVWFSTILNEWLPKHNFTFQILQVYYFYAKKNLLQKYYILICFIFVLFSKYRLNTITQQEKQHEKLSV